MEGQNGCQNDLKNTHVAIVMVPFPAQSHLNQLLHLSHFISSYGLSVHFAGSAMHIRQAKLRFHVWNPESSIKIQFHDLQLPHFSSPPPNPDDSSPFPAHLQPLFEASKHLQQPMFELLQQLSTKLRRIVVIHDSLMSSVVQDAKVIPNAEFYSLFPVSAFYMFLKNWEATAKKPFHLDVDFPESIIPSEGCMTPEFENFVDNQFKLLDFQSGRIYNTCRLVEGKYVELLERLSMNDNVKHFALGPFSPVEKKRTSEEPRHGCAKWLDEQEKHSVIYVSFGSTTSMSDEQTRELALGLEESGQKFIWVLRRADKADIFVEDEESRPELPEGFEERVKDRGIVVRDWAPQLEILAHPSTGGFMSHCGWNSCLESISMGVPIAAWPMHSDQPRNAFLVTDELQIGLAVRDWARRSKPVTSYTIEQAVRRLMTSKGGEEMRKRAAELGQKLRESFAKGGGARLEMESFIAHIMR